MTCRSYEVPAEPRAEAEADCVADALLLTNAYSSYWTPKSVATSSLLLPTRLVAVASSTSTSASYKERRKVPLCKDMLGSVQFCDGDQVKNCPEFLYLGPTLENSASLQGGTET